MSLFTTQLGDQLTAKIDDQPNKWTVKLIHDLTNYIES